MTKPNLQEIPDQKHPGTPKTRSKKPLIMVASLISSMVAAVVVGLLIVNSSAFKSFRSELASNDTNDENKSTQRLSKAPVKFDENYEHEPEKRPEKKDAPPKTKLETKPKENEKPASKPVWKNQASHRPIPLTLIEPGTEVERLAQSVLLAISQREYDEAVEMYSTLKKNPKNTALAFTDLDSRLDTLEKFWRTVRIGLVRCTPGTEIKLNGQYVLCISKSQDSVTFRQADGAEKSFTPHADQMKPELAVGLHHSVEPNNTASADLFLELDFVGDKQLLAAQLESVKRATEQKTAATERTQPRPEQGPSAPKPSTSAPIAIVQEPATPVPSKEQLREPKKLIRSLFSDQYADRSENGKRSLATLLLTQGLETKDDPVARYALLSEALEFSKKVGDTETAWAVTDVIVEDYEVDPFEFRCDVLRELGKSSEDPAAFSTMAGDCQELIDRELELDQYESALAKSRKLLVVAKKGANEATIEFLDKSVKRIKKLATAYSAIEDQVAIAKEQPGNQAANQATGEFYCFQKGDFDKGLPFLALGDSAEMSTLAKQDLNSGGVTEQLVALGDSWWELAENENSDHSARIIKNRAFEIYFDVVAKTTGLTRKRIEKRLSEREPETNIVDLLAKNLWQVKWESTTWEQVRLEENQIFANVNTGKNYVFECEVVGENMEAWTADRKLYYQFQYIDGALQVARLNPKDKTKVYSTATATWVARIKQ